VPVNVGEDSNAYPEIAAPAGITTVPVNVGEAIGALSPISAVKVAAIFASSFKANAISSSVFKVVGAAPTMAATAVDAALSA